MDKKVRWPGNEQVRGLLAKAIGCLPNQQQLLINNVHRKVNQLEQWCQDFFGRGPHFDSQKPGGPQAASHPRDRSVSVAKSLFSLSCGTHDRGGVQIKNVSMRPASHNGSAAREPRGSHFANSLAALQC